LLLTWRANNTEFIGYGAARSGPTLAIQFGIAEQISFLVDAHPSKVNKRSAFRNLLVRHPKVLDDAGENTVAVVLAWIHAKKILRSNEAFIERGGVFLLLWPEVTVVDRLNFSTVLSNLESL